MALFHDPDWPRASAWLQGGQEGGIGVIGAPVCKGSISPGRCDLAPQSVRDCLAKFSTYDFAESRDVSFVPVQDFGDLSVADMDCQESFDPVSTGVQVVLEKCKAAVVLGGDNSVTRGGVHGLGKPLESVGLLTLDAHLDVRSTASGLTNGNPVRALLEDGMKGQNIVQIGIQSFANSRSYSEFAKDSGVRQVGMEDVLGRGIVTVMTEALTSLSHRCEAIYFDLDLDVMDQVFAPGCPGSRPGGLAPWQVLQAARTAGRHVKVRAMDLVELDPSRDTGSVTAMTAANCLLAFASGFGARP